MECSVIRLNGIIKSSAWINASSFRRINFIRNLSSNVENQEENVDNQALAVQDQDIGVRRNKSRLNLHHLNILKGLPPYDEPQCDSHRTLKYKRKMFGRYGSLSGVDPATLWPSNEEINKVKEFEAVAYPLSIHENLERIRKVHEGEVQRIQDRQDKVAASIAKMGNWKKEVQARQEKKLKEFNEAKAKRDALLEEVKAQFGFKIDVKDERFIKALAEKERVLKKKMKEEKAKAKQERLLAQMSSK